ncbi:MAG: DUF1326 domain-containing protein [Gammaproteobacteria bacterium]|nr:DUF1326 domain-containing protein [Gammaproteobacteria bacterium]
MPKDWRLEGTYFEGCNCDTPCPCIFLQPPSQGFCEAFVGWHIARGHADGVSLDDLNVSAWLHAPGSLTDGGWKLALYVDERADDKQQAAIEKIWSGEGGGHLAIIASLVGEVKGVKKVPIEYREYGKARQLRVEGVGELNMDELGGEGGRPVLITNHPLAVAPGNATTINVVSSAKYSDYDVKSWGATATTGLSAPFVYGPYEAGMLELPAA